MVQNQWDQLLPALDRGNFDIILNGLEITADNRQHAAMSRPYYVYAQQIVTRADSRGADQSGRSQGANRWRAGLLRRAAAVATSGRSRCEKLSRQRRKFS